jgi:hypothetical protein
MAKIVAGKSKGEIHYLSGPILADSALSEETDDRRRK